MCACIALQRDVGDLILNFYFISLGSQYLMIIFLVGSWRATIMRLHSPALPQILSSFLHCCRLSKAGRFGAAWEGVIVVRGHAL